MDGMLPELLHVEGRTAIRIHAANEPAQLEGCIATGRKTGGDSISTSRVELEALLKKMQAAYQRGERVWIDVRDPA
jgi:hypothetical protein